MKCSICRQEGECTRKKNGRICDKCLNQINFEQRVSLKIECVKELGGKCQRCGYCKSLAAFDFHHTEERELERGKSLTNYKKAYVEKEIKKCILLCRNCHAEEHAPNLEITDYNHPYYGIIESRSCPVCGTDVVGGKYCSAKCSRMDCRKTKRPSKKELKKLLDKMSWTAIGNKYGVSDNAVRKWAKQYEIIK